MSKQYENVVQLLFIKVEQSDHHKTSAILTSSPALVNQINPKSGQTLLTVATRKNDIDMVKLLLEKGAQINLTNKFNQSPLWIAVYQQYEQLTDLLICQGCNLDQQDKKGWTPLMVASHQGNVAILRFLIEAGAQYGITSYKGENIFDVSKDVFVLNYLRETLKLQDVKVKQPQKFKQKSGNKSRCSPSMKGEISKLDTLTSFEVDQLKKSDAFSPTISTSQFKQNSGSHSDRVRFVSEKKQAHQQSDNSPPDYLYAPIPNNIGNIQLQIIETALNQLLFLFNQQFSLIRQYIMENSINAQDMDDVRRVINQVPVSISQNTVLKDLELCCNEFKSQIRNSVCNSLNNLISFAETMPTSSDQQETIIKQRRNSKERHAREVSLFEVAEEPASYPDYSGKDDRKTVARYSPRHDRTDSSPQLQTPIDNSPMRSEEKKVIVNRLRSLDQQVSQRIAKIHSQY